jgi:hypothetical protein
MSFGRDAAEVSLSRIRDQKIGRDQKTGLTKKNWPPITALVMWHLMCQLFGNHAVPPLMVGPRAPTG